MTNVLDKRQKLYPPAKHIGYVISGYARDHIFFTIKTRCIKKCINQVIGILKGVNKKKIKVRKIRHRDKASKAFKRKMKKAYLNKLDN